MATRLDIAEDVLTAIVRIEYDARGEANALSIALRYVLGAWLGHGFSSLLSDLEVLAGIEGFKVLTLQDTGSLRARGLAHLPNQHIEQARRLIRDAQTGETP